MKKVTASFVKLIVNSPVYPHWLSKYKTNKAEEHVLKNIRGDILEVGAGDCSKKEYLLEKYKSIKSYTASDYSSWDEEFEKVDERADKFFGLSQIIFGAYKTRAALDKVCSATDLPFEEASFDYHLSFDVLEHIDDPSMYFKEATRVIKPGGCIIVAVPFLFRMHGGEPDHELDHFRYAHGFFHKIKDENNLSLIQTYNNTGYGTTLALLTNHWLIRRIYESNILIKVPLLLLSPVIFLIANLAGLLIDTIPDKRFATRFHVVMQKN